jgi:hypothetical protein
MRLLNAGLLAALCLIAGCTLDFDEFSASAEGEGDGGPADGSTGSGDGGGCDAGRDCTPATAECDGGPCRFDAGMDGGGAGSGGGGKGGHGGKGGPTGPTNDAPEVEVIFPPPGVTDRDSIAVRGRVSDPEGDAITKLTINGKAVKVKGDGSFSATVPLKVGRHPLAIHVEDDGGGEGDVDGNEIERFTYLFQQVSDMALDAANGRVIALDGATDAIVAIDLDDGTRTVIAEPSAAAVQRTSLDLDAAHNRVLVGERNPGALAFVDLDSGQRTVVSDSSNGGNFEPHSVLIDPEDPNRAFVAVAGADATAADLLFTVDLDTGVRTAFPISGVTYHLIDDLGYDLERSQLLFVTYSGLVAIEVSDGTAHWVANTGIVPHVGTGAAPANVRSLAVDGDRVLALGQEDLGSQPMCVHEIGIVDNHVTELAALTVGDDAQPLTPYENTAAFAYDSDTGDALVLDVHGRLLRVRLSPGAREYVSTKEVSAGPAFDRPVSVIEDPVRNRWIVADDELDALIAVDKRSGERSVLSDDASSGTDFDGVVAVAYLPSQDEFLVLTEQRVFSVDPVTGARTVIASDVGGSVIGSGTGFAGAFDIEPAFDGASAIVAGCYGSPPCQGQLIAVDLATGNRTLKSGPGTGTGPLDQFVGFARGYDTYLVLAQSSDSDDASLVQIHQTTGDRTVISDADTGGGPKLRHPKAVTYDSYERRAIVINDLDTTLKLIGVDLTTGDRTLLTEPKDSPDNPYPDILSDALVDVKTHRVIVAEGRGTKQAGLLAVDLADRKRTLIDDQTRGPWNAISAALDSEQGLLYGAEQPADAADPTQGVVIAALDLRTGERSIVSDDSDNGGATRWTLGIGLSLDPPNGRLVGASFINSQPHAVVAVDLEDGAQTVIAKDDGAGGGDVCQYIWGFTYDVENERSLLACPGSQAIIAVGEDGVGHAMSSPSIGAGDALSQPVALTLDPEHNRVFVLDLGTIVAVDLTSGDREAFAGPGAGTGPDLVTPGGLVIDYEHGRALMVDSGDLDTPPALIAIDLDDESRTLLTTLPRPWFNSGAIAATFAYDPATQIAYIGALHALDLVSGQSISIAGNP